MAFARSRQQQQSLMQGLCLVILSSAITFVSLVLLARSGHIHVLTTVVERVHQEFPLTTGSSCHCPAAKECINPKPSQKLYPKVFGEVPILRPLDATPEGAKAIDWDPILLTPNGGFLMVEGYDHSVNGFGVSMFHQFHCLTMIRTMLLGGNMSSSHEVNGEEWKQDPLHFLHCLDYMAQAILCAADDTLEKPMVTTNFRGDIVEGIDGMGHTHQCRNASLLYEVVLESAKRPVSVGSIGTDSVFM